VSPSTVRVLLADDSADVRDLTRRVLERTGQFTVLGEASDGQEAIDLATELQPDLVLLDLAMPIMDGLTALPLLREAAPSALLVVLSGLDAERMAPLARAKGASAFMPKALPPAELAEQLVAFLGQDSIDLTGEPAQEAYLQLDAEPASAPRARSFVKTTLEQWDCAELADIVLLLTSELVTNAVLHAGSEADLSLRLARGVLQIAVADRSPVAPVVRRPSDEATGGRGMLLLDAMSLRWSVIPTRAGKIVWFEVPTAPARRA
jgi:DNA-binding NarL/FixJ family response regulator